MKHLMAGLAGLLLAAPVAMAQDADGDPAAGENDFKQCRTCHAITDADGNDIVKGGKVGPNLYGIIGSEAGAVEDFRYKKSIEEAREKGLVWDEASFEAYVQDPTGFLREYLDDNGARSGMTFKLREGAADVYAYLASLGGDM